MARSLPVMTKAKNCAAGDSTLGAECRVWIRTSLGSGCAGLLERRRTCGGTSSRNVPAAEVSQLTHGNQIHAALGFAQVFAYSEADTVINGFPLFHVGGTMTMGLSLIAGGGHIVVPSPYGMRAQATVDNYWRLVESFGLTVIGGVPTSIAAITNSW